MDKHFPRCYRSLALGRPYVTTPYIRVKIVGLHDDDLNAVRNTTKFSNNLPLISVVFGSQLARLLAYIPYIQSS